MKASNFPFIILVICRIGSLEIHTEAPKQQDTVICRIGSLENLEGNP